MSDERRPTRIDEVLKGYLRASGLEARVARAQVLVAWESFVGPQIARVTQPRTVTDDGTLFVGVSTHAWMTELSLMERSLLAKINARLGPEPLRKIRWELLR